MKPAVVEIKIIPATIEDKELFFEFLKKYFYPDEPMNSAVNRCPENLEEEVVLNRLSNGYCFKAVDQSQVKKKKIKK